MLKQIHACLIHLLISLLLVSSVLAFVLLVCYPDPYFEVMGVKKLLIVLAIVDICIGPVITLIIFNPAKKWMKLELAFVAILQISALAYGVFTVFVGRPVYVVFDENGFSLVSAYQIPQIELEKMDYPDLPMNGPKLVGARIPATKEERKKYIAEALKEHVDLPRMLQYHVPYETMVGEVKAKMRPLDKFLKQQPKEKLDEAKLLLDGVFSRYHIRTEELAFIPMTGREDNLTVLLRRSDASIVTILAISSQ